MTTDICLEVVQEAIHSHGRPEIFNLYQGSQFTSLEFTKLLKDHQVVISMDGKGNWRENKRSAVSRAIRREGKARHNLFVERLWKSIKYEDIYLRAYIR